MRLVALICLLPFLCVSQSGKLDSMTRLLKQNLPDTERALTLCKLGRLHFHRDLATSMSYYRKAFGIYARLEDAKGLARVNNLMGNSFTNHGIYDSALASYRKAYAYACDIPDSAVMAQAQGNIGTVYFITNNYNKALEHFFYSLRYAEQTGSVNELARSNGNIGNVYKEQGKYREALVYYFKGRAYAMQSGKASNLAINYINSGNVYYELARETKHTRYLDSAYHLYTLGESTLLAEPDSGVLNMLYVNMGNVFADRKQYAQAMSLYKKAIDIKRAIGEESQLALVYENIATCYLEVNRLGEALGYIKTGLAAAEATQSYEDMSRLYKCYSDYYKAKKSFAKAYDYYVLYKQYADSVLNEDNIERRKELEMNYAFDKEREQKLLEDREKEVLRKEEKKRSRIYIGVTVGGLLVTIVIALMIFRNLRLMRRAHGIISAQKNEIEMQKNMVEAKQKEILDSIHYAKRIQRSLLPSERYIERQLKKFYEGMRV